MKQSNKNVEEKKITKLKEGDKYLSYHILKAILQETDVPKKVVEEKNSELFYETLSGKGKILFSNSMKYYGPVKNGLLETKEDKDKEKEKDKDKKKETCIILFSDGTKYEGEIHSNKISGEGKYYFPTGAKYTGHLLNGLRDGFGKYFSPEGVTYVGEWKGGLKEGKGIMKCDNMTYDGDWKKGNIDGEGKIRWENGNIYEGQFKINHINGYGYMIWHDLLEKYIGKWKDDKQNGNGIHIWYESPGELKELRNRYVGEWKNGERNGYGVFFYSNGARYEGEWKNNLKTGFGIMTYEDGKKYIGRFEEDRLVDKNNELSEEKVEKLYEEYLNKNRKGKKENTGGSNKSFKKLYSENITWKSPIKNVGKRSTLLNINSVDSIQENKEDINKKDISTNRSKNQSHISNNKKKLYKFIPIFNLSDLEYNYPEIIDDEEEITKVLLRNLTGINKLYNYLNKLSKVEVLNDETGTKNMIIRDDIESKNESPKKKDSKNSSKSIRLQMSIKKSKNIKGGNTFLQLNTNLAPKIEEQIRSDDIYFCNQLRDFWYYARENGLFNNEISLSEFNRIFNQGRQNSFEAFQLPITITDSHDLYNYIDNLINQSKKDFIYKYQTYIKYYYKDTEIPEAININSEHNKELIDSSEDKRIINSIHDKNRIILPRFFYECLIRLAFLTYQKSKNIEERNMKLSKKLENILEIIIPAKMKKKTGMSMRLSMSKLEQSMNNSANILEGNKTKISEFKTIEEFLVLFKTEIKYLFDKIYNISFLSKTFYHKGDKTIQHLFLYKKVICKSEFLRQIIPDVLSYVEIASYFYNSKLNFMENLKKMKKDLYFDTINNLLLQELNEYEFYEIIYLICKKYLSDNNKKLTFNEVSSYLKKIKEIFDGLKISKQLKKRYCYPKLKSHIVKEQLIYEEKKRIEDERKRKLERERYLKERENFGKEDVNVYVENNEEEENDMVDSEDLF